MQAEVLEMVVDHICLGRFYPKEGVPGVLSLPVVDPSEIDTYREVSAVGQAEDVHFFRLTSIPKQADDWLLPGDVVCRYGALDEAMMDLVRPNATSLLVLGERHDRLDHDSLDKARSDSIGGHCWSFHRSDTQLTICDPFGRVAALCVAPGRLTRIFKRFSSIVPKTETQHERHARLPSDVLRAGQFVLRTLHREMLKHGRTVPTDVYRKFRKAAQHLYDQRIRCAKYLPDSETLRIHFSSWRGYRQRSRAFIGLCKQVYQENPSALPRPLRLMASKHYHIKWVRLSPNEWEECIWFWYDHHDGIWDQPFGMSEEPNVPFGMSVMEPGCADYKRWAYKN